MDISLPLDKMTNSDKIAVMEKLWDELCRDPESIPSPEWHKDTLKAREKEINEGKAKFTAFDQAKERIRERNAEMSGSQKMEYRIGINIGDVVDEEGRIYGDGVNIAARLEALAEPGGICISGLVYSHVKNKLKLEYEFLGKQTVKNISEPVKFNHERNCCSAKSNNDRFHFGIASL